MTERKRQEASRKSVLDPPAVRTDRFVFDGGPSFSYIESRSAASSPRDCKPRTHARMRTRTDASFRSHPPFSTERSTKGKPASEAVLLARHSLSLPVWIVASILRSETQVILGGSADGARSASERRIGESVGRRLDERPEDAIDRSMPRKEASKQVSLVRSVRF